MEKIIIEENPNFAKRVVDAAYDYLGEGASYRKVAPLYDVSYVTIKSWFDKYLSQIDSNLYELVRESAESRQEKTISNPDVLKRISTAVVLITEEDKTIKEIADELDSSEWTIYNDLVKRLQAVKSLGDQYYGPVREALSRHSINNSPYLKKANSNLEKGKNNGI